MNAPCRNCVADCSTCWFAIQGDSEADLQDRDDEYDNRGYYEQMAQDEAELRERITTPTGEICPGCSALYEDGDPYVAHIPSCTHH